MAELGSVDFNTLVMVLQRQATNLQNKQGIFGLQSENEDILLHVWSYQDTIEAKAEGILNSAAVTIALQWLEVHHINLQDRC